MNQKPSAKFIIVMNLVMNIPMAVAMSVTAGILSAVGQGQPASSAFSGLLLINILIGFVCACIINAVVPVQKIVKTFPAKLGMNPDTFLGALVGNLPVVLIFVVVIGIIMTVFNVMIIAKQPFIVCLMAFLKTFIPLYVVCLIVAMIFAPIALKAAMAADKK